MTEISPLLDRKLLKILTKTIPRSLASHEFISVPGPGKREVTRVRGFDDSRNGRDFNLSESYVAFGGIVSRLPLTRKQTPATTYFVLQPSDTDPVTRIFNIAHSRDIYVLRILPEGVEDSGLALPYERQLLVDILEETTHEK